MRCSADSRTSSDNRSKEIFTFTGRLSVRREGARKMATEAGHGVSSSVTARSTAVVAGALRLSSKKMNEAFKRNIPIVSEDEFFEMTGNPAQLRLFGKGSEKSVV